MMTAQEVAPSYYNSFSPSFHKYYTPTCALSYIMYQPQYLVVAHLVSFSSFSIVYLVLRGRRSLPFLLNLFYAFSASSWILCVRESPVLTCRMPRDQSKRSLSSGSSAVGYGSRNLLQRFRPI